MTDASPAAPFHAADHRSTRARALAFGAWLLAAALLAPFWWLLPGIALAVLALRRGEPAAARLIAGVPLGIAAAVACASVCTALPVPLTPVMAALSCIAGAALALAFAPTLARGRGGRRRGSPAPVPADVPGTAGPAAHAAGGREAGIALLLLTVGAGLYAWPLRTMLAPAGIDMTMHMMLARLVDQHDGIPPDQSPLYPGVPLAPYPAGFHALVALTSGGPIGLLRAGLLVVALTHALLPWCLYLTCRRRIGDVPAAAAALLTALLSRTPQGYVGWGGNPCALSIALGLGALRMLWDLRDAKARALPARVVEAGLWLAAVPLTHPTPALMVAYTAGVVVVGSGLAAAVRARGPSATAPLRARAQWTARLAAAAAIAALILLPWALAAPPAAISARERSWILHFHRAEPHWDHILIGGSTRYAHAMFGDGLLLASAALAAVLIVLRRGRAARALAWLLVVPLLEIVAALAAGGHIPPAIAMYPERLMPFAVVGFAVPMARALDGTAAWMSALPPHARRGRRWRTATAALGVVALSAWALARHQAHFTRGARNNELLTRADLAAMAWIQQHTPAGSLIDTNYGDGGAYVPAVLGRPITRPQTNSVWFDEMQRAMAQAPVRGRLRGVRRVAGGDDVGPLLPPDARRFPERVADQAALADTVAAGQQAGLQLQW